MPRHVNAVTGRVKINGCNTVRDFNSNTILILKKYMENLCQHVGCVTLGQRLSNDQSYAIVCVNFTYL